MEVSQIRYFSRLYETLSYSRAADDLFITRQALHKTIKAMEREVQGTLFERVGSALVPTRIAHEIYRSSRTMMRGLEEIDLAIASLRLHAENAKVLGRMMGAGETMTKEEREKIARFDRDINDDLPFELHAHHCNCDEVREGVLAGIYDYGIVVGDAPDPVLFDAATGKSGCYRLLVRKDNPMAVWDRVGISDLKGVPLAVQGKGFDSYELLLRKARDCGFEPYVVFSHPSVRSCVNAARAGRAVACSFLGADELGFGDELVDLPFTDEMVWRYSAIAKKGLGDPYVMRYFCGFYTRWDSVSLA